jgi:hypothetical protein
MTQTQTPSLLLNEEQNLAKQHNLTMLQQTQPSNTTHTAKPPVARHKRDSGSSAMKAGKLAEGAENIDPNLVDLPRPNIVSVERDVNTSANTSGKSIATVSVERDVNTSANTSGKSIATVSVERDVNTSANTSGKTFKLRTWSSSRGFDLRGLQNLCYKHPNDMAIKIQSVYRGYLGRSHLRWKETISKIEALWDNNNKRRVTWGDDTWDGLETEVFYAFEEPFRREAFQRRMHYEVPLYKILKRNAEYAFREVNKMVHWLKRNHPHLFTLESEYYQRYRECYFFRQRKDIENLKLKLTAEFGENVFL